MYQYQRITNKNKILSYFTLFGQILCDTSKSAGSLTKTGKEGWNIYDLNIMENDLLGGATSQTGIFSFPELQAVAAVYFREASSSSLCCVPVEKGT